MGLRLSVGIDIAALEKRFGMPVVDELAVRRYFDAGLIERVGDRIRTSSKGRLVLDSLIAAIAA